MGEEGRRTEENRDLLSSALHLPPFLASLPGSTMLKRLIEVALPLKEVSAESAREKSIRHGHISTLHIWWARRPLASSRSTSYAALIPAPSDATESSRLRDFIINLCKWENSLNQKLIERAREDISQAN